MVFHQKENGLKTLKKRPRLNSIEEVNLFNFTKKIDKKFFISLEKVLSVGNVKYFQLRLKKLTNAISSNLEKNKSYNQKV